MQESGIVFVVPDSACLVHVVYKYVRLEDSDCRGKGWGWVYRSLTGFADLVDIVVRMWDYDFLV